MSASSATAVPRLVTATEVREITHREFSEVGNGAGGVAFYSPSLNQVKSQIR